MSIDFFFTRGKKMGQSLHAPLHVFQCEKCMYMWRVCIGSNLSYGNILVSSGVCRVECPEKRFFYFF